MEQQQHDNNNNNNIVVAYSNFYDSIRSNETKKKYSYLLKKYQEYTGQKDLLLSLSLDSKTIETSIISYILHLRKKGYSYSSMNGMLAAVTHFYVMNDVNINRHKIARFMGEHKKTVKDRAYTRDEIKRIVDACDLKYKIVVTLMVSTGCRIGAIANLKLSDLKYWENEKLYQITFYRNSMEEYFSFCSPECAKYILEYLNFREWCGEKLTLNTPLIRDDFQQNDSSHSQHAKHNTTNTFIWYLRNILLRIGLRKNIPGNRNRKEIAANHGIRKFTMTTMANAKINPEIREMLLGHSIAISTAYFRPTEQEMLDEYLEVVDDLTVNEENRLKRENEELKTELEERFSIFASQLQEIKKKMGFL